jgi:serine/threonine protein kinase
LIRADSVNLNFRPFNTKTIARGLFFYFKKLPQPLLTFELHDFFLGASYTEVFANAEEQIAFIRAVVNLLPRPNRAALCGLLEVFDKIFKDKNRETQRATVDLWGPVLLCRANIHDVAREIPHACSLLKLMIENFLAIFPGAGSSSEPTTPRGGITGGMITAGQLSGAAGALFGATSKSSKSIIYTFPTLGDALNALNHEKVELMKTYLEKLNAVMTDTMKLCIAPLENLVPAIREMKAPLYLLQKKMEVIVLSVSNPARQSSILHVLDTYHLERFYSYLLDFHSTLLKGFPESVNPEQFSVTHRTKGVIKKLIISMHYELAIFFAMLDFSLGERMQLSVEHSTEFRQFSVDLISDPAAKTFWEQKFGPATFLVEFRRFVHEYSIETKTPIDPDLLRGLQLVLDNTMTGFVSALRFGQCFQGFGPFEGSTARIRSVVCEPWFNFFLTKAEAEKLLEPFAPFTFLVRFTDFSPDAFSINYLTDNGRVVNIQVVAGEENTFAVKEGQNYRMFPSVPDIVSFYSKFLQKPLPDKVGNRPWFFGEMSHDDAIDSLIGEEPGTFVVRFSRQPFAWAVSYVDTDGVTINQARLKRFASDEVEFNDTVYANVEAFVAANSKWFSRPYRPDFQVSSTQESDALRRSGVSVDAIEDEEEAEDDTEKISSVLKRSAGAGGGSGSSSSSSPSAGAAPLTRRTSSLLSLHAHQARATNEKLTGSASTSELEDQLATLLNKSASVDRLDIREESRIFDLLFRVSSDAVDKISKKVHKSVAKARKSKSGEKIKFASYSVTMKNVAVNVAMATEIKITNEFKDRVRCTVDRPSEVTSQFFLAVSPAEFELAPKESRVLRVTCVLYKPTVLKELVVVKFTPQATPDIIQAVTVPVKVIVAKESLVKGGASTHWELVDVNKEKQLGGGAAAKVWQATICGAKVALKEFGSRDPPPNDFWVELGVFNRLHHDNLIPIVGAIGKKGEALIAMELLRGGSLDKFLGFQHPDIGEDGKFVLKPAQPKRAGITIRERLQIAVDAARGILYLHDHNLIHRDVKSLNLLIDPDTLLVKVSDFGEAASRDSGMKEMTGSLPWMAPEVTQSSIYSMKADVFSFGLVLYEILCMCYPARTADESANGALPPIPEASIKECPELVTLIYKCCRQHPDKRPYVILRRRLSTPCLALPVILTIVAGFLSFSPMYSIVRELETLKNLYNPKIGIRNTRL